MSHAENFTQYAEPYSLPAFGSGCHLLILDMLNKSRCHAPASVAQLDACPTGDQEVAGSTPAGSATFFHGN